MSQAPAGWYPDPAPAAPGAADQQRYWDGARWTEHVHPGPSASAGSPGYGGPAPATTPDGQRLAGWWHRVGAFLLDTLLLVAVSVALGWPFVHRIGSRYVDFFHQTMRASEHGTPPPSQLDLVGQVMGPILGYLAVSMLVSLVYNAGFLKTVQGTPGKLAVGLRVRLRERPGPLPWRAVLLRWLVQNVASIVAVVPVLGTIAGVFPFLDDLWPLWDEKKQALHDKVAATNVVRT
jgi:uncharacterized RDD family membrane protein YckC